MQGCKEGRTRRCLFGKLYWSCVFSKGTGTGGGGGGGSGEAGAWAWGQEEQEGPQEQVKAPRAARCSRLSGGSSARRTGGGGEGQ